MKKMRRILALMLIFVMAVAVSACGGKKDGSLSKDEYKKKVQSLSKEIETESAKVEEASTLAGTDPIKAKEDLTAIVDKIKPLYKEMGELKAPKDFEEQQAKLKVGTDAAAVVLDLTIELLEVSTAETPDADKLQEVTTRFQTKTAELTTALTDMDAVLTELSK